LILSLPAGGKLRTETDRMTPTTITVDGGFHLRIL